MEPVIQKTADILAARRTDLAVDRTVMAAGRTLMAWVRTALSLISFGFTIYKFLQAVAQGEAVGLMRPGGPRRLGLFLIAMGTVAAAAGAIEYARTITHVNGMSDRKYRSFNFPIVMISAIGLLGIFLFVTIFMHAEVF